MQEFFDRIPDHGPVRPSKRYQERLGKAVERSSRLPSLTHFGASGDGSAGGYTLIDQTAFIFAEITAQPSVAYTGYSWQQRRQDKDNVWVVPPVMLRGDNGSQAAGVASVSVNLAGIDSNVATLTTTGDHGFSPGMTVTVAGVTDPFNGDFPILDTPTSTTFTYRLVSDDSAPGFETGTAVVPARPRSAVANSPDGDESIPAGTIVILAHGYLHTSATSVADLPLVNPLDPLGGSEVDSEAALGRDWVIILGGGSGSGSAKRCRITGRPYCIAGKSIYPAVLDLLNATGADDFHDGTAVWVRQRRDAPLGTTGVYICLGLRERGSFSVATGPSLTESRPLYVTKDRLWMLGVECVDGELVPTYEDNYEGCTGVPMLDFSVPGNSMYKPLMFNPGVGGVI